MENKDMQRLASVMVRMANVILDKEERIAKKWSGKVETKWKPPEGLFTKKAPAIVAVLKKESKNLGQAIKRLNFFMNRAGKKLENRAELEKALNVLQKANEKEKK